MKAVSIEKANLPKILDGLRARYEVVAPVREGDHHEWKTIGSGAEADLAFRNTRLSVKGLFFPEAERMFRYSFEKGEEGAGVLHEDEKVIGPRVVFGVRPCDAKALALDDVVFDSPDFKDPWWVRRREATTLVGLCCNDPCTTCFCTSVGGGPHDASGLDVTLCDLGDTYLAEARTEKGEALLAAIPGLSAPAPDAAERAEALKKAAEAAMPIQFRVSDLAEKTMMELFEAPFWEEVAFSCINCGTCTYLCPTCTCFDVQDEVKKGKGDRLRLWDSCMYPLFTLHGSGHNPRSVKAQRVRQRFMHKLKYYLDKNGRGVSCVGCGRCVTRCPVNIDIREVARRMAEKCACAA